MVTTIDDVIYKRGNIVRHLCILRSTYTIS